MLTGLSIILRHIAMIPADALEAVTLGSRQTRETGYSSVTYSNARRMPADDNEVLMAGGVLGEDWITFELYKTTETTDAKQGDKLTDEDSVVWQVKKIKVKFMKHLFRCLCLKNV